MMTTPGYGPPPRRVMIFYHGDRLKCFNGHAIDTPVIEQGVVPCRKLMGDARTPGVHRNTVGQCGQLLYLLGGVGSLRGEGGGVLVTEITAAEMHHLDRSGMSPKDVLRYLGLTL